MKSLRSRRNTRNRRAGLLTAAIAFARSPQGQRLIMEARRKYDTPENRLKLRQLLAQLKGGTPRR